jgi:hypothetical protein
MVGTRQHAIVIRTIVCSCAIDMLVPVDHNFQLEWPSLRQWLLSDLSNLVRKSLEP